ncbi:MAG: hypothetical protein LH650_13780 [Chloroflexi bacterium]|nr:hypothetical protein [Chloroflexota bacterium]
MRPSLALLLGAALVIPTVSSSLPVAAQSAGTACLIASPAPERTPDAPLLMPEDARLGLFDAVWGAINEGYLDAGSNGVDWAAVGDEYAPYFLQTENAWEVYDLVEEMVGLLKDDEVVFGSPLLVESLPPAEATYAGIGTLLDTSSTAADSAGPLVLYVFPGSGAEQAGIRPRDRLVSVDGTPCVTISAVRGPEGTTVTLGVESPGEPVRGVTVERRRIQPLFLPVSHRIGADDRIGYLRLPSIEGEAMPDAIATALGSFVDGDPIDGLVIDVRAASLGALGVTLALLSHITEGSPGTLYSRTETSPLELPDSTLRSALAEVPIAVLVDDSSAGEAERLALMLQASGRATVLGQATPGRIRGVTEVPFPDGSVLQYVTVGLELADGTRPGRSGVTPDVPLEGEWLGYAEADDPWILAAVELLESAGSAGPAGPAGSASPSPTAGS